jgi:hypothetical protein
MFFFSIEIVETQLTGRFSILNKITDRIFDQMLLWLRASEDTPDPVACVSSADAPPATSA